MYKEAASCSFEGDPHNSWGSQNRKKRRATGDRLFSTVSKIFPAAHSVKEPCPKGAQSVIVNFVVRINRLWSGGGWGEGGSYGLPRIGKSIKKGGALCAPHLRAGEQIGKHKHCA